MAKRITAVAILILVAGGAAAWYWWPRTPPPDPKVQEARVLQTKLMADFGKTTDVKQTVQSMTKLRDSMEKMSPEQQRQVMTGPGGPMDFMRREAKEFAETPAKERDKFLDKRIDQMEKMMAAFRQSGGRPMGPPREPRGPSTPENRLERSKKMLDATTPEDRAMFSEYFSALMERRKERGLPGFGPR